MVPLKPKRLFLKGITDLEIDSSKTKKDIASNIVCSECDQIAVEKHPISTSCDIRNHFSHKIVFFLSKLFFQNQPTLQILPEKGQAHNFRQSK